MCEVNQTLHNLLQTLPISQKTNWSAHLTSLVFAYIVMPNSNRGQQPNQLMFGCKAQMPSDNWPGLKNYDSSESVSKGSWVWEHHKLMQAANQHALKNIQRHEEQSALRTGGKELSISEGNVVILWDHTKGHNKIQDHFKDQEFVVVEQLHEPDMYCIKPVNGVSLEKIVNCRQLQDLQKAHNESDTTSDEEMGDIPSFNPKMRLIASPHTHKYATWTKG